MVKLFDTRKCTIVSLLLCDCSCWFLLIIFKKGSLLLHYQCGVDVCRVLRGVYTFTYNLKLVQKCFICAFLPESWSYMTKET